MKVETPEFAGMVRQVIRAYGRRVADADPEDLAELVKVRDELDAAILEGVRGLRARGVSWARIGSALGITKQAAQQWFERQSRIDGNSSGS